MIMNGMANGVNESKGFWFFFSAHIGWDGGEYIRRYVGLVEMALEWYTNILWHE